MTLEVAILNVIPGLEDDFLRAFDIAKDIISKMAGYLSHQLKRCIENTSQFILLVKWEKLTDHTEGFRRSKEYQEWKGLLHHFYDPFPVVEHYEDIKIN
jgi:heme-degrading monooxygenase HmoA